MHGVGEIIAVRARLDGNSLRVGEIDRGSGFDYQPRPVRFGQPRGNGLAIVDAIATRWGLHPGGHPRLV